MKKRGILLSMLLALSIVFVGCQSSEETPEENTEQNTEQTTDDQASDDESQDSSSEAVEFSVAVEVIDGESIELNSEKAEEIGVVDFEAAEKAKDGEEAPQAQTWTGVLLVDLLANMGVEEYSVISVEGSDGTVKELDSDRVDEEGTGLAWKVDGESLDEKSGPVQLVNNDRGPKWWIKDVTKVTIIK